MSGAIVRELVTVLGFKTDLKGIKDSEKALLSFKTKVALGATAALTALSKTLDFFGDVAEKTLETKDIADATGISLANLRGMGQAAADFGLRMSDINAIFQQVNTLGRQALFGQGELYKLASETGIAYKDNNNELLSTEKIFQNILSRIGLIQDTQKRIAFSSQIFGPQLGPGVARLSTNLEKFNESAARLSIGANQNISENISSEEKYRTSIIKLENSWNSFVNTLVITVQPLLSGLIFLLEKLLDVVSFSVGAIKNASFKKIGEGINYDLLKDDEYEQLQEFSKKVESGKFSWKDFFFGTPSTSSLIPEKSSSSVINNFNNQIDIQIPPGMSDPQQIGDYVATAINDQIAFTINQIYNNNPQVE